MRRILPWKKCNERHQKNKWDDLQNHISRIFKTDNAIFLILNGRFINMEIMLNPTQKQIRKGKTKLVPPAENPIKDGGNFSLLQF